MSSLTESERAYFESVLDMEGGYVLNFKNSTFAQFFQKLNIDIYSDRYGEHGNSKANRMRAFWHLDSDEIVGGALSELLDLYETNEMLIDRSPNLTLIQRGRTIVDRLRNGTVGQATILGVSSESSVSDFLGQEFDLSDIENLPVEEGVVAIIQQRISEAQLCLSAGAHLSVIFLCGSVLEGALLGLAINQPEKFNRSNTCPKEGGKPKPFHRWSLSDLINVANETGFLKDDVKKFSHGLRDFRNYIHPYQQMLSKFQPDEYTAKLCFQALKAALADVSGQR